METQIKKTSQHLKHVIDQKIGICPGCEERTYIQLIQGIEEIQVKGEDIPVVVEYFKCLTCQEEFEVPKSPYDLVKAALDTYDCRKRIFN